MSPLNGEWRPVLGELGGEPFSQSLLDTITLEMHDGEYRVNNDRGSYTTDLVANPNWIDMVGAEGPNAGQTIRGIFKFDGEQLVICYELLSGVRPASFTTESGTRQFMVRYRRV